VASRKTVQAMSAVNSPSAFSSRDAPEAGIDASPSMSSTGPSTPPNRTAPASGSHPRRGSRTRGARRTSRQLNSASPDAVYSSPASSQGPT